MALQRVAVTGANGFVGGRILAHLRQQGVEAIGIVRAGRAARHAPGPMRELSGWTEEVLARALSGVTAVVHAAAVVHRPGAAASEYREFNVEGARALAAAARSSGVARLVFLSSIKVYGEEPAGVIDEDTPVDRSSPYAATKLDAEQIFLESSGRGGPSSIALRLCPVYGAGDKGNVRRVAIAIARRRFVVPGDGSTRKSVVHVSTVARAVHRALECDVHGAFVLSDRQAPSMRELGDTIARALGRRRPPALPVRVVLGAALAAETLARLRGRSPNVTPELIRKSLRSSTCSPARLEQALGLECDFDLREGIEEEVAWLRRERLV